MDGWKANTVSAFKVEVRGLHKHTNSFPKESDSDSAWQKCHLRRMWSKTEISDNFNLTTQGAQVQYAAKQERGKHLERRYLEYAANCFSMFLLTSC